MIKDKTIICDLDSTIVNSSLTIINLHNKLNPNNQLVYTDNHSWVFEPIIKTKEELSNLFKLFDHEDFYKDVIVFPNAIEIINELAENNSVYIVSKHSPSRKPITTKWINKVMPKVEIIFVDNFEDKGKLFDNCDYIIDDKPESFENFSDKTICILYGMYDWNKDCTKYRRCMNWDEINNYIEGIEAYKEYVNYHRNNFIQFAEDYLGVKLNLYQKAIIKLADTTGKIKYNTKRR